MILWVTGTWLFYLLIFNELDTFINLAEVQGIKQSSSANTQNMTGGNSILPGSPTATLQLKPLTGL